MMLQQRTLILVGTPFHLTFHLFLTARLDRAVAQDNLPGSAVHLSTSLQISFPISRACGRVSVSAAARLTYPHHNRTLQAWDIVMNTTGQKSRDLIACQHSKRGLPVAEPSPARGNEGGVLGFTRRSIGCGHLSAT